MVSPAVTVGLPVYNGGDYLPGALDAILSQSLQDFRLVISDNASSDDTMNICRDVAARDSRVAYVRQDVNRGAAWNFNHVFALCDTPYFRWAAADDLLDASCIERCLDVLSSAPPSVALCYPRTMIIDGAGQPVAEHDDKLDIRDARPHERVRRLIASVLQGNPCFGLFRSDVLRRTRGHGSFPSADYVLLAEIALAGEIWEIPDRLFYRRLHPGTSRAANPTPEQSTRWLDPTARPVHHEELRLLREYLAAVRRSRVTTRERAVCYAAVVWAWSRRHARSVVMPRSLG